MSEQASLAGTCMWKKNTIYNHVKSLISKNGKNVQQYRMIKLLCIYDGILVFFNDVNKYLKS